MQNVFSDLKLCVVIPTYNNEKTLASVVEKAQQYCPTVMVVNDGSTDSTPLILNQLGEGIIKIQYTPNRGKGYAMRQAFRMALAAGYDYVLTMDADGQHLSTDLPKFAETIRQHPDTLIVGSRGRRTCPRKTPSPTAFPTSGSACKPPTNSPTHNRVIAFIL